MATVACSTGSPVCKQAGNAPNGQSCGNNLYCNSGNCAACTPNAPCVPFINACHTGSASCIDGGIFCNDTDASAPPGTSCGTNQVCDNTGTCVGCTANASCNPGGNVCQAGVTSCATGAATCVSAVNVPNGTPCGTNQVCNGGTCNDCQSNASCNPGGNTCVTGYVDCTSGAPVCTKNGVAAAGTACGSNQVCDGNGGCGACTAGTTCNPGGNVCQTGTTSCSTGSATCTSVSNVADGTSCGSNQVCAGGSCVACTAGVACNPNGNVCLAGHTSCASGASVCVSDGYSGNGVSCGTNQVCNTGVCTPCTAGVACSPNGTSCETGTTTCGTGSSTCQFNANVADGTSCGSSQVCSGGSCVACVSNTTCHPGGNVCVNGTTTCASGSQVCGGTPTNVADGTSCGTNMVCSSGTCTPCTSGTTCTPATCKTGTTSCNTGTSACTANVANLPNGTSCGLTSVCNAGSCVACTAGGSCNPGGNMCQVGTNSCSTGSLVCGNVSNVADGTSCGGNQVCSGGNCISCTAGQTCNPSGNLCQKGTTSCSTGSLACTSVTNVGAGVGCGTNQVCNGSGACVACSAGVACNPGGNLCLQSTTSCATGAQTCPAGSNVPAGATCGTNQVCNGSGTCVACTAGGGCTAAGGCQTGTYSCATGAQVCTNLSSVVNGTPCNSSTQVCLGGACNGCVLTLQDTIHSGNATLGNGELYTADGKLECGSTCSTTYTCGTSVTVQATDPYFFYGYSDSASTCTGEAPCTFTINKNFTETGSWALESWNTSYSVSGSASYSNNNTTVSVPGTAAQTIVKGVNPLGTWASGPQKYYWEIHVDATTAGTDCGAVGIVDYVTPPANTSSWLGSTGNGLGFGYGCTGCQQVYNSYTNITVNTQTPTGYQMVTGMTYMFALDVSAGYLWVGLNGSWLVGNPATGTSPAMQGAGLVGGANTGPAPAVFGYGTTYSCTAQFTGHFNPGTYTYTPPYGF